MLENNGTPVKAKIVQGAFGNLLAMLEADQANMAVEIEPTVSIAVKNGAHIVYSFAKRLNDFAFTGLMVSDRFHKEHPEQQQSAVNAITRAMRFIREDFDGTLAIAKQEFPDVPVVVLKSAIRRLIDEGTIPKTPVLSKTGWDRAIRLRQELGDLKGNGNYYDYVDMTFAERAASKTTTKTDHVAN